jgi:formylglycine-generating enzyme required for sulfatase activity
MTTCAAGLGDCDRDPSNGCETNLGTSTSHCGRCANTCAFAGARAVCAGGACLLDACDADRANCDADASNGCETYTGRSAMHCGRCGVACASGVCVDGTCVPEQRSCAAPTTPGCGLVNLPGGTFSIGSNATCAPGMKTPTCAIYGAPEVADVRVSPFTVDAYEVTVARYRAFLAVRAGEIDRIRSRPIAYPGGIFVPWAGASTEPVSAAIVPTCNWSETIIGREAHPINCIGWWAAQEFCAWDGGRLPTEAEWEYAARGRVVPESGLVAGRIYPWGNQAPMTGAMLASCDRALLAPCPGEDGAVTRRVGRFAAAAGVYDIAGNVAEWLADTYNATSFRSVCWPSRVDPICTMRADLQLIAGGAWVNGEVNLRAASRVAFSPALPLNSVGFRCVRSR